jgi:hypothetical protein
MVIVKRKAVQPTTADTVMWQEILDGDILSYNEHIIIDTRHHIQLTDMV